MTVNCRKYNKIKSEQGEQFTRQDIEISCLIREEVAVVSFHKDMKCTLTYKAGNFTTKAHNTH